MRPAAMGRAPAAVGEAARPRLVLRARALSAAL
jgi:hypothetical protein